LYFLSLIFDRDRNDLSDLSKISKQYRSNFYAQNILSVIFNKF